MFTMTVQLGGKAWTPAIIEFGHAEVRARGHTKLFDGIEDTRTWKATACCNAWMSHGDKVTETARIQADGIQR